MGRTISIDPLTRIEGHLAIQVDVEGDRVARARSSGEMFRGFEAILHGRDPLDAQQITQRICGVCPISHGLASIQAQEQAYDLKPAPNGRIIRNLVLAANTLQSHIIHFYHLSALDFVDIAAITEYSGSDAQMNSLKAWVGSQQAANTGPAPLGPFLPRYEGQYLDNTERNLIAIKHYVTALDIRRICQDMIALYAGKMPHAATLVPGGATQKVTAKNIAAFRAMLDTVKTFIDGPYLSDLVDVSGAFPDYFKVGGGCKQFMAYPVYAQSDRPEETYFPGGVLIDGELQKLDVGQISEDVGHSYFKSATGLHPARGQTEPQPHKSGAYTWLKAPRYAGQPMEVGPLSRLLVAYHAGHQEVKQLVDSTLASTGREASDLHSVMGRHLARGLESKLLIQCCERWLDQLQPNDPVAFDFKIPKTGQGVGLTEAPRGALGHWIEIADHKIKNYQCVVPTTWNCSPRDDRDVAGPVEQALVGTPVVDADNPIEAARVVRSFDPCLACAVH